MSMKTPLSVIQRIVSVCAHAYLQLRFPAFTDTVLVAIPSIALCSVRILYSIISYICIGVFELE